MATEDNYLSNCFEELKISSIITLQALVRGFLVRKWFQNLREEYLVAVTEIEQVDNINVEWGRCLSSPQFMKRSQRKPKVHDRRMSSGGSTPHGVSPRACNDINPIPELNNVQLKSGASINIQATADHTPEWPRTMEAEETVDMFCTVETQTSMIDTTSQHQNVDSQNHHLPYSNKDTECIGCAESSTEHGMNVPDNIKPALHLHLNLDSERTETKSETEHKQTALETQCDIANKLSGNVGENQSTCYSDSESSVQSQTQLRETPQHTIATQGYPAPNDIGTQGYPAPNDTKRIVDSNSRPQEYRPGGPVRNLVSPVPRGRRVDRQELSTLTNVTSVWDSNISVRDSYQADDIAVTLPSDRDELQSLRKNIALELLWIQQAINSRKNYLRLKQQM